MNPAISRRVTRAEKVQANTEALRDAAFDILLAGGYDALTFQGVAREAGLTVGAVYSRFDTHGDVVIDLWHARLREWFEQWVDELMEAGHAGDDSGDVRMGKVLKRGQRDGGMGLVCLEVLLSSLFDDELSEVVATEVREKFAPLLTLDPARPDLTPQLAAANMLLLSFAFGRLIAARESDDPVPLTKAQLKALAAHAGGELAEVDIEQRVAVGWRRILDPDDHFTRMIEGSMDLVAKVGYSRSTITRIARRAGVSRGGLLAGYPDKATLVADAAQSLMVPAGEVWETYLRAHEGMTQPQVRAVFLRDFLTPGHERDWKLNLELNRVALHEEVFEAYAVPKSVLEQTHLGVMVAACFAPDVSDLPYYGCFLAGIAAQ
jgi:AcrR family transcriptional regulator